MRRRRKTTTTTTAIIVIRRKTIIMPLLNNFGSRNIPVNQLYISIQKKLSIQLFNLNVL